QNAPPTPASQPAQPGETAQPAQAGPAATPTVEVRSVAKADVAAPAPAGASPAAPQGASPEPAAPAARTEPTGKLTYGLDTSIAPVYFDPLENTQATTPYIYSYLLHDAMLKHLPGQPYAPSLAESYEIAPDFRSATFRLRPGVKFHNGEPVTVEDVKWTFENYKGANAKVLKDKTASIETPDARTVRFVFKEPFLDFLTIYGSAASGAGWIVPSKYYQEVGPDGFKRNPIGAGPYKLVRQVPGNEIEVEAVADYHRKAPKIKTIVVKTIPDAATRVAAIQTGEVDLAQQIPYTLIDTIRNDPNLQLVVSFGESVLTIEFPAFERPESPFHDKRIRQAVSLALDRQALTDAETGGLAPTVGNWIPEDWPGALKVPAPQQDLEKAKQLMVEAGYPDGFDAETITPVTPTYASLAERVLAQLRPLGIRARLNTMELAAYLAATAKNQTPEHLRWMTIETYGGAGDAAGRIESAATCTGARTPKCIPEVEEMWRRYQASTDPRERESIIVDIQNYLLDNNVMVPMYRNIFFHAQGPRVANDSKEIWGAIPQFSFLGPYEDIRLTE
ncbi:MAG TPA: ABC transporter substrate-binding protein, partial [Dehalococcoidia bacterium]|nr:ABC transporter substrate-binding protein [Dehalococcoidia bacterium]